MCLGVAVCAVGNTSQTDSRLFDNVLRASAFVFLFVSLLRELAIGFTVFLRRYFSFDLDNAV